MITVPETLALLDQLATEIEALQSKLILLIGGPNTGKTALLAAFAARTDAKILTVGLELGNRLSTISYKQRHLQASTMLRELADEHAKGGLLLLDNLELLFDATLQLSPLDLLKQHAHIRRVVAAWPGEMRDGRLSYAEIGHSEYRDYATDGLVTLKLH